MLTNHRNVLKGVMPNTKSQLTEIGSRIKELRKWLRISQSALGEYLDIPRSAVSVIESGDRDLSTQEIIQLSRLFRCDPNSLLGLTKTPVDYGDLKFKARANKHGEELDPHDRKELAKLSEFLQKTFQSKSGPNLLSPKALVKSNVPQQAANELRQKLQIKCPVDIFSVIEKIGLYPRFTSLIGLAGAIVRAKTDDGVVFGILINSDQPEERTRFSAAHEIAHYVLEHLDVDEEYHSSPKTRWRPPVETDADSFAAELLVPQLELSKAIGTKLEFSATRVLELADDFLVSYLAMLHRLLEYRYISKVQFDEFQKFKASELRLELKGKGKRNQKFDVATLKLWIEKRSEGLNPEFVNSPDWIRFVQEVACFEYWKATPFNDRATEVKDVYEQVALWIAKHAPPKVI